MNASPYEPETPRTDRRVDEPGDAERQPAMRAAPDADEDQSGDEMPEEPGYGHGV